MPEQKRKPMVHQSTYRKLKRQHDILAKELASTREDLETARLATSVAVQRDREAQERLQAFHEACAAVRAHVHVPDPLYMRRAARRGPLTEEDESAIAAIREAVQRLEWLERDLREELGSRSELHEATRKFLAVFCAKPTNSSIGHDFEAPRTL